MDKQKSSLGKGLDALFSRTSDIKPSSTKEDPILVRLEEVEAKLKTHGDLLDTQLETKQSLHESKKINRTLKPTSFYLLATQVTKLDELMYIYNQDHPEKRINRNDIVRHLIDQCSIESLNSMENEVK